MTFMCIGIAKLECQISLGISFLSLISPCMIYLKENMQRKKSKAKRSKMRLNMIANVYSKRCTSYRMYLEGDSLYQTVMIVCELKLFSHILNHYNMLTHLQSCDIFHTQHAKFFATLDTCAGTM